jgi:hypothetical protein
MKNKILLFLIIMVAGFVVFYLPHYQAQQKVKRYLNDPESAQFSDIRTNPKTDVTCGSVNSKNRMGGYVGARRFVIFSNGTVDFEKEESLKLCDD